MAGPLANSKHEQVALAIFSGATLAEAAKAGGFTGKWPESHACNIAKRPEVRQRLEELHKLAADEKIMSVIQRKIRLSELARDPNSDVCPVRCIHELNLMERIYQIGSDINIDQRVVNIQVVSDASERATKLICEGIKTSLETDNDMDTSSEDGGEEEPVSPLQASEIQEKPSTSLLEPSNSLRKQHDHVANK